MKDLVEVRMNWIKERGDLRIMWNVATIWYRYLVNKNVGFDKSELYKHKQPLHWHYYFFLHYINYEILLVQTSSSVRKMNHSPWSWSDQICNGSVGFLGETTLNKVLCDWLVKQPAVLLIHMNTIYIPTIYNFPIEPLGNTRTRWLSIVICIPWHELGTVELSQ